MARMDSEAAVTQRAFVTLFETLRRARASGIGGNIDPPDPLPKESAPPGDTRRSEPPTALQLLAMVAAALNDRGQAARAEHGFLTVDDAVAAHIISGGRVRVAAVLGFNGFSHVEVMPASTRTPNGNPEQVAEIAGLIETRQAKRATLKLAPH